MRHVQKPWGRDLLPAPFSMPSDTRIGEIWFEPPAGLPDLLIKYIFTSEKLSVQVHPSGADAPGQGKDECWLIIDAEPDAEVGIGFKQPLDRRVMRQAAMDGAIEHLMARHKVRAGDFFYIPAGTVHSIGPGISLIEIQQNSDVTYRLYDYGRPRELHLDLGIEVACGEPFAAQWRKAAPVGVSTMLVDGPVFSVDQVVGWPTDQVVARYGGPVLVVPREGSVRIAGCEVDPGSCGFAADLSAIEFSASGVVLMAAPCRAERELETTREDRL